MEECYILHSESVDCNDPHGYFSEFGRQEANFKSPTKRSFLNECIRQIYIINGNSMPNISIPVEYNKGLIWNTLNAILMPVKMSTYQASVQRVKRRLFREPKQKLRKSQNPKFNGNNLTECLNFKASRHNLGIRKIPRSYLDQARQNIKIDLRQNLKRKHLDDQENEENIHNNSLHFNTSEGVFQVSQQVISKVCRYHGNMARHHPQRERSMEEQIKRERNTEACRLSRRAKKLEEMLVEQQYRERLMTNEKVLEASLRSILYMKALMGLMVQQDDHNLFI
ncbi:uncharacterized protein ACRADG_004492 [Cochliomyia hominivorax]